MPPMSRRITFIKKPPKNTKSVLTACGIYRKVDLTNRYLKVGIPSLIQTNTIFLNLPKTKKHSFIIFCYAFCAQFVFKNKPDLEIDSLQKVFRLIRKICKRRKINDI